MLVFCLDIVFGLSAEGLFSSNEPVFVEELDNFLDSSVFKVLTVFSTVSLEPCSLIFDSNPSGS